MEKVPFIISQFLFAEKRIFKCVAVFNFRILALILYKYDLPLVYQITS